MKWYYIEAGGDEVSFTTPLIDNSIDKIIRDGIKYRLITVGTPTGKQCKYNSATGEFSFDPLIPFAAGEELHISYKYDYVYPKYLN